MAEKRCETCAAFVKDDDAWGDCHLNPATVRKDCKDFCLQHRYAPPSEDVLQSKVADLPLVSVATRKRLANCGIKKVRDLMLFGRSGMPDPESMYEVAASFKMLGIDW